MSGRGSLSGRLARLKKEGLGVKVDKSSQRQTVERTPPEGWERISSYVWSRTILYKNPLPDSFKESLLIPRSEHPDNLIFYDTETTGLSTGAGTIPFLIGFGRKRGDSFQITQLFLSDYPGEKEMMEEIKRQFSDESLYISYNGKSYDSHLINTRFLMNGIQFSLRQEVDLLYPSRRLWKNLLDDCRLGTIEEKILSIKRGPDIPGSEIPDVWFDFLKDGNTRNLELVFSHNLQDIHTLAVLLSILELLFAGEKVSFPYDRYNLGKMFLKKFPDRGKSILREEWNDGNRIAGMFLSLYLKKTDCWEQAVDIWEVLNRSGLNYFSVEELAKYYEHRVKQPEKALAIVEKMLKGPIVPSPAIKEKLQHRKRRLTGKINRI